VARSERRCAGSVDADRLRARILSFLAGDADLGPHSDSPKIVGQPIEPIRRDYFAGAPMPVPSL